MIYRFRPATDRGYADHGWLHARFTFSFASYHNPEWSGFHGLIVLNNDIIEPGGGFPFHSHRDAEIFTYVISGQLQHQDSMGNGSIISPGNLQYMSAGSGVTHSEFNPSKETPTELYQIWMLPNQRGGDSLYAEKKPAESECFNEMSLLFSGDGENGSFPIRQNAQFWLGKCEHNKVFTLNPANTLPHAWIQVVSGKVKVEDQSLGKADGLAVENLDKPIKLDCHEDSTFFLFRLPAT